jgi:ubiquinone/menaquinone biosynthesis C-methylase UbiE
VPTDCSGASAPRSRRVDFDDRLHRVYADGRRLSNQVLDQWMDTLRASCQLPTRPRILDLGSGTGRFTGTLAGRLGGAVIAVEPSANMRRVAAGVAMDGVAYVGGRAEQLPLGPSTIDLAWLSMVVHHLEDRPSAIAELHRVLSPGGLVFVRNTVRDWLDEMPVTRFFPGAGEVEAARLPAIEELGRDFRQGGFEEIVREPIVQEVAGSLAEYRDRLAGRSLSVFDLISERQYQQGLQLLDEEVRRRAHEGPVRERLLLLGYRRHGPPEPAARRMRG